MCRREGRWSSADRQPKRRESRSTSLGLLPDAHRTPKVVAANIDAAVATGQSTVASRRGGKRLLAEAFPAKNISRSRSMPLLAGVRLQKAASIAANSSFSRSSDMAPSISAARPTAPLRSVDGRRCRKRPPTRRSVETSSRPKSGRPPLHATRSKATRKAAAATPASIRSAAERSNTAGRPTAAAVSCRRRRCEPRQAVIALLRTTR